VKRTRQSIERIHPVYQAGFDQQFWPVVIALIVLCSLAAGAISTLLRGPWMWGSLLILPAAAAVAIFILYRLGNSFLRRTLQLSILISLALHLLILIAMSLTYVFDNSRRQPPPAVVAKQPERRIVVSNQMRQLTIRQPQKHHLPEVAVEAQKQVASSTTVSQSLPLVEQQSVNQPFSQRRRESADVPPIDGQLSRRSQNNNTVNPQSRPTALLARKSPAHSRTEPAAVSVKPTDVQAAKNKQPLESKVAKSEPQPPAAEKSDVKPAPRRRDENMESMAVPQIATARLRENRVRLPNTVPEKPSLTKSSPTRTEPTKLENSPATILLSRSDERSSRQPPRSQPAQDSNKSPTIEKAANKRSHDNYRQLTEPASQLAAQRTSAEKSPIVQRQQSPQPVASSSPRNNPVPRPRETAVSRSTAGSVGSSTSRNVDRLSGGAPSPSPRASDASNKRSTNLVAENVSLSSLQSSAVMESGRSIESHRVLRNENARWASRAAAQVPSASTAQSAAATIDSATTNPAERQVTEKGTSMLDTGATKVVAEMSSEHRGGGGLESVNPVVSKTHDSPSGREWIRVPSSADQSTPQWTSQSAKPNVQDELAPASTSEAELKTRSTRHSTSNGFAAGQTAKDDAEEGSIAVNSPTARRTETEHTESLSTELPNTKEQMGNASNRIAQAPIVTENVRFGSASGSQTEETEIHSPQYDLSASNVDWNRTGNGDSLQTIATYRDTGTAPPLHQAHGVLAGTAENRRETVTEFAAAIGVDAPAFYRSEVSNVPKIENAVGSSLTAPAHHVVHVAEADSESGELSRQRSTESSIAHSVAIEFDAEHGPGGISDVISRRLGSPTDSIADRHLAWEKFHRFKRSEVGGVPLVNADAPIAREAFRSRKPAALADSGPQTEAAIELGLDFLARHQLADGSWTLGQFDQDDPLFQNQLNSDTAATGLALLAFQGAGYTHREYKYAAQLRRGIAWLIASQTEDGGLYLPTDEKSNEACRMYSHAIAALALTESYGMTQDAELREPTQRALDYISATQDRRKGGWRYFAESAKRSSDTSVTGWMMMALKSGELAGLQVPQSTIAGVESWLRVAEVPNSPSEFRYNPYAVDSEGVSRTHGKNASITMTSVGLLMRVYAGWGPADEKFLRGVETLFRQMPGEQNARVRDTYYWYYATQVIKHAGGEYWKKWSSELHPLLINTQEKSGEMRGSWHPYLPVPDRWGPQGGRLYVTTMNILSLEVKYRLLPLYEKTIK
jgi:hypothetical protein